MKPIKSIFLNVILSLLALLTAQTEAAPQLDKTWIPQEQEYARIHVTEKGTSIHFFYWGRIAISQDSVARMNPHEQVAGKPTLEVNDATDSQGGVLASLPPVPKSIKVCPYTEYELRFSKSVESVLGSPPFVSIDEWDINYDQIVQHTCEINASKGDDWQVQSITLRTGPKTHYLSPMLHASNKGTAKLSLGGFELRQISEPMVLRPEPKMILECRSLKQGKSIETGTAGRVLLSHSDVYIEILAEFTSQDFAGEAVFAIEWLGDDDKVLGTEFCCVKSVSGIQPQWNGIDVSWMRKYGEAIDGASLELMHANDSDTDGRCRLCSRRLLFDLPDQTRSVRLKSLSGRPFQGKLELESFRILTW